MLKPTIKNAHNRNEERAAEAAIAEHQRRFGDSNKNKVVLYSIGVDSIAFAVEVVNRKTHVIADVRNGHRKLVRLCA